LPTNPAALALLPATQRLSAFDLALVAVYLIAITLFGLRFRERKTTKHGAIDAAGKSDRSLKSYFLANNTIPWWAIALSIVSAETSTLTIISVPGVAFTGDFGFLQIVLGYMLGRIVVAALFLPRYFAGSMLTAYQLIERRFGSTLHKVTAGLFLITRAAAEGVRVFAVSIVVGIAIGTKDTLSIGLISLLTLLYTFEGGMAAVIWTDVVQMAIYIAGTFVAIWSLGHHIPGGWSNIHAIAAPLGKFHVFNFALNLTQSYTFWAGVLGGTFLTMASHGTDQLMVQRMLAARSLRESRLALLSSGAVIFLQFTLFLLIGVGLYVFYTWPGPDMPGLSCETCFRHSSVTGLSPDRIFPTFIVHELPIGIAGLLVAAILAAAMSNLSAALNSLSSTTVVDFYMHLRPQADARERNLIAKSSTVLWAIVLFAIAVYSIHAGGKGHVVEIGLSIASVAYGCLLGVFLLGALTKFATQTGATIGMICGFAVNLVIWQFPGKVLWRDTIRLPNGRTFPGPMPGGITIPHIAFTWYVLIGSLATFLIGSLASLIFRKQSAQRTAATITHLLIAALILSGAKDLSILHAQTPPPGAPPSARPNPSPSADNPQSRQGGVSSLARPLSPNTPPQPDFSQISQLINTAIAAHKLPGAVVLIGHNNQIVFEQTYGLRKLANEPGLDGKPSSAEPMTEDTIFDMASLTKCLVTATAIMQLYEAGKIASFDDPLVKYLPEFITPQPHTTASSADTTSTPSANGAATSQPSPKGWVQAQEKSQRAEGPTQNAHPFDKSRVTLRMLLTHTSGEAPDVDLKDPWGLTTPDKAEGIHRALTTPLQSAPGETFRYSDINFILLGHLVETLSGKPLDEYATDHIFNPLGMTQTRYLPFNKWCGPAAQIGAATLLNLPKPPVGYGGSCPGDFWDVTRWIANTAPTAHDNEGTPATNPDFDHLLRGTVHDPTARRMGGVAGHAGVFSTAHDISLFAQALLQKLRDNTGPFPLKQSTLEMMTLPQQPGHGDDNKQLADADDADRAARAKNATTYPAIKGQNLRGFGWDIDSDFSRPRGTIFPIGSFGHTGFTGTSLWLDPTSNTYVILLANAIHPRGNPPISHLRGDIATAAAQALGLSTQTPPTELSSRPERSAVERPAVPADAPTLTGIDVLEQNHFTALANLHRIALLTNQTGLDSTGRRTIDILHSLTTNNQQLTTLFSPEHGIFGHQDSTKITAETDPTTHLPVISLYGPKDADKRPSHAQLKDLDAVIIDLQDAGVRFYTYETVVGYFLEAAATEQTTYHHDLEIILLDRPNLIDGEDVQGPISDPGSESYINYMPLPLRHGLTLGELAKYIVGTKHLATNLTVIPMQHWSRTQYFDQTGLPWHNPSPNLRYPQATITYPALGLLDYTNISVGRGTPSPFSIFGAGSTGTQPAWFNAKDVADALNARHVPGISFGTNMAPIADDANHYPYHGQTIPVVEVILTVARPNMHGPHPLDTPELGIEILAVLHRLYPTQFNLDKTGRLLCNRATLDAITRGDDPRSIAASWQPALDAFKAARAPYLLYP